ncbi:MAG: electron transfer flavoprotein subunit alpha/FixB family protein [Spirochaetales bacterium]|nr:electron transfer flavoprotein subunit alpha/FixB family protein [Spirochaetales bacterium]
MKKIFVYAEKSGDSIHPVYYELLSRANLLSENMSEEVLLYGVLVGGNGGHLKELAASGADKVIQLTHSILDSENPECYSMALEELCRSEDPEIFLVGSTVEGTEIAPTLGVKLKTGVAAHCMDLRMDEGDVFVQVVPAFGGKVLGEILTPSHKPQIATVKPGLFQPDNAPSGAGETFSVHASSLDGYKAGIELVESKINESRLLPVEKAEIIVCGGFGVGEEGWPLLDKIASNFDRSAVGCTRPALDEGWTINENTMIGTSGKSVRPKVYLGFGISGAAHHVCGTSDADIVISVNHDENAEIFKTSDYKVVNDAGKVLSALIEQSSR